MWFTRREAEAFPLLNGGRVVAGRGRLPAPLALGAEAEAMLRALGRRRTAAQAPAPGCANRARLRERTTE